MICTADTMAYGAIDSEKQESSLGASQPRALPKIVKLSAMGAALVVGTVAIAGIAGVAGPTSMSLVSAADAVSVPVSMPTSWNVNSSKMKRDWNLYKVW